MDVDYRQTPFHNGCQYVMLLDGDNEPIKYDKKRRMCLMTHNGEYRFLLVNGHDWLKAEFIITVDGDCISCCIVDPNTQCCLKRPSSVDRKLIFVARNSQLGRQGGLDVKSESDLGVCKVEVRLEKPPEAVTDQVKYGSFECECCEPDEVGGTVLGDEAHQEYTLVPPIDTEKLCVFEIKMGLLRPESVPLASYCGSVDYEV